MLAKEFIAQRVAKELENGDVVKLGIGCPLWLLIVSRTGVRNKYYHRIIQEHCPRTLEIGNNSSPPLD